MTCTGNTAPRDISLSFIGENYCDAKCAYSFTYADSTTNGIKYNDYISLTYENGTTDPVIYSGASYYVQEIRIYTPSLHAYNGKKTEGEMIIVHKAKAPDLNDLLVCVPIKLSPNVTKGSQLLASIIETMAPIAKGDTTSTQIHLDGFNLAKFIPKTPYFSYKGSLPYQDCGGMIEYIVFSINNGFIDISANTLNKLISCISANLYDIQKGNGRLFYNERGPGTAMGDQIYIDCKPTGLEEETIDVVTQVSEIKIPTIAEILANPIVQMILSAIVFIIIILLVYIIIQVMSGKGDQLAQNLKNITFKKSDV